MMRAFRFVGRVALLVWFVGLGITFVVMVANRKPSEAASDVLEAPPTVRAVSRPAFTQGELDAFQEQVRANNQIAHECSLLHDYFGDIDRFPPVAIPDYQGWNQRVSRAIDVDYHGQRHKEAQTELCQRFSMTPDQLTKVYFRGIQEKWNQPHNDAFDHLAAQQNTERFLKNYSP